MIPTEDQIATRVKMFDRLKSSFPWLARSDKSFTFRLPALRTNSKPDSRQIDTGATQVSTEPSLPGENGHPTLQELIDGDQAVHTHCIYLGLCEDGLPLTVNLDNPAPGAILIAGDPKSGKTRLLRSILFSAAYINSAADLLFFICTDKPEEYEDIAELENCQEVLRFNDHQLDGLINELSAEVERRRTKPQNPMVILVLDNLDEFIKTTEKPVIDQFFHLIKHGPRYGIWSLASLSSTTYKQVNPLLLDAFRTHLIGYIANPDSASFLSRDTLCPSLELTSGDEFCASVSDSWLRFRVCDPMPV